LLRYLGRQGGYSPSTLAARRVPVLLQTFNGFFKVQILVYIGEFTLESGSNLAALSKHVGIGLGRDDSL
jgi:hypothetical protein